MQASGCGAVGVEAQAGTQGGLGEDTRRRIGLEAAGVLEEGTVDRSRYSVVVGILRTLVVVGQQSVALVLNEVGLRFGILQMDFVAAVAGTGV